MISSGSGYQKHENRLNNIENHEKNRYKKSKLKKIQNSINFFPPLFNE